MSQHRIQYSNEERSWPTAVKVSTLLSDRSRILPRLPRRPRIAEFFPGYTQEVPIRRPWSLTFCLRCGRTGVLETDKLSLSHSMPEWCEVVSPRKCPYAP